MGAGMCGQSSEMHASFVDSLLTLLFSVNMMKAAESGSPAL